MVQLRSVSGAARLQWTNEGHSIFSLHKLQKGGDSRFPHAMEPRLCCRCSVHNLYGVVEVRGQPHVSFFIFFSFWDRLCWSTDYPLGYTECPAIPRLGLQAHTSMPGLIMQFLRDGTGPCVCFSLRCLPISKLLFVDWVKWPEDTSEPSIFHTFDTSKSWVCWPLDIGSLTCPTWESPPKTSHLVGLSLGPKSCLFWQIFGESPLRKTVLEQPESPTLFFGKVNDLIFIGI